MLTQYIWTGCTRVSLRDQIMSHATELIRQIIRKQGLHTIYPGQEESAFGDLLQTAWVQIERTLYKYRACPHCRNCFNSDRPSESILYQPDDREYGIKTLAEIVSIYRTCPHCAQKLAVEPIVEPAQGRYGGSAAILYRGRSKVFNMWSQIARTVILAFIKKEGRDRKNSSSYITHLGNREHPIGHIMTRFIAEARQICKYHEEYLGIITALEWLLRFDERHYDGLIGKLVERSGRSRAVVTNFFQFVRLRSFEFTDSPVSMNNTEGPKIDKRKANIDFEDE